MDRPNILLITTDQQRFDTINALGNPHIYTPHLNWLVDEGITYRCCYSDGELMFNLEDDQQEQHNLINSPDSAGKLDALRKMLFDFLKDKKNQWIKDGKKVSVPGPEGPRDVNKWPGFHSTVFPSDVLH